MQFPSRRTNSPGKEWHYSSVRRKNSPGAIFPSGGRIDFTFKKLLLLPTGFWTFRCVYSGRGISSSISHTHSIKFCPSPSSVLKILAEAYILSTEYEVIGEHLQLIFCSQERYIERDHLQVKGHLGEWRWRRQVETSSGGGVVVAVCCGPLEGALWWWYCSCSGEGLWSVAGDGL